MRYQTPPSRPSPPPSGHSTEVEHRLTVHDLENSALTRRVDGHDRRITFLERMLQGIIYALGVLSAAKTGDVAELLISILKARP